MYRVCSHGLELVGRCAYAVVQVSLTTVDSKKRRYGAPNTKFIQQTVARLGTKFDTYPATHNVSMQRSKVSCAPVSQRGCRELNSASCAPTRRH